MASKTKLILTPKKGVKSIDVFEWNQYDLKEASKQSSAWFRKEVAAIGKQGFTAKRVIGNEWSNYASKIVPGKLYLYVYDAKHKDTLPYWDKFPLVFPFSILNDGFIGINMHYLPYEHRIKILNALIDIEKSKRTGRDKLILSWKLISKYGQFIGHRKWLTPCVHRYLTTHIKSNLREIPMEDWATAMMLPVEGFVNSSKTNVWKDTKRKAGQ